MTCVPPNSVIGAIWFDLFLMEDALKCDFLSLMPAPWKIKLTESGQILNDINCACQNLICFRSIQEALSKHLQKDHLNKQIVQGFQAVLVPVDVDAVVAEIVSVVVEVAAMVDASSAEDMAEIAMPLNLLILLLVILQLLKDVVLLDIKVCKPWST